VRKESEESEESKKSHPTVRMENTLLTDKFLYIELTPKEFLERLENAPIAYVPLGTLEWHGPHLPLGTDGIIPTDLFSRLARSIGGIVLPMLFMAPDNRYKVVDGKYLFGMDVWKSKFPKYEDQQLPGSAYFVGQNLYAQLLHHVLARLARAGFKVVVGHGHGPACDLLAENAEKWGKELGLKLFIVWPGDGTVDFGIPGDHAGSGETSMIMGFHPELVHMEDLPTDLKVAPLALGPDDPRVYASPERGKRAMELMIERMTPILTQALSEVKDEE
jgi:creatinine amidohydrolase